MNNIKKSFQYGSHHVTLETGGVARHADGSILIRVDETVLLVTVVGVKTSQPGQDFVPLTVHYQEKAYAAGNIPGGYFKREGKPTERETLISRLIDRPLRPLFPKGFAHEVQIIATLLSQDPNVPSDIPAIIGASAALAISGIPFNGPVAAARVGYQDGKFLLNPSTKQLENSKLDLVVAGTRNAVLMVESEADQLPEEVMLEAVLFGHEQMQVVIRAIEELAKEAGKARWEWQPTTHNQDLKQTISSLAETEMRAAYQIADKLQRQERLAKILEDLNTKLCTPEEVQKSGVTPAGLKDKAQKLLDIIKKNPHKNPPPYEKLLGDLSGAYSRRINIQHRLIYQILEKEKAVKVLRLWSHYK